MNNLITNYQQILSFASRDKVPLNHQRAIIREYLQSMALATLYEQPDANHLVFTGETSLRLLRNIDRFSEDLDFDNLGLSLSQIDKLINSVKNRFGQENIIVELITTHRGDKNYYELRFPNLLFDLKISTNPREKLMIKIDYTSYWQKITPETLLFSKYGFIERITTNPLNHLLVQKLGAYVNREQTQPRDIYDIVWLYSQGARYDQGFADHNNLPDLLNEAQKKFSSEGISKTLQSRLQPFLFQETNIDKLHLFPDVIQSLLKSSSDVM